MQVGFKVGKVVSDTDGSSPLVCRLARKLAGDLSGLQYFGSIRESNSNQLDVDLDERLCGALEKKGWRCDRNPPLNMSALAENWGRQKADAILTCNSKSEECAVIEIEKSNMKTIWFDFIKLWMFIEAGQAAVGLILCPTNYAHKLDVWNLYDEACRYKRYLHRFAGVPQDKLRLIGLLGFQQLRVVNGTARLWDIRELKRVKQEFRERIASS